MKEMDYSKLDSNLTPDIFRAALHCCLKRLGIKQKELAEKIGMSPTQLSDILWGNTPGSHENHKAIAEALGIELKKMVSLGVALINDEKREVLNEKELRSGKEDRVQYLKDFLDYLSERDTGKLLRLQQHFYEYGMGEWLREKEKKKRRKKILYLTEKKGGVPDIDNGD